MAIPQFHQGTSNFHFEAENETPQPEFSTLLMPKISNEGVQYGREDRPHYPSSPSYVQRIARKPVPVTITSPLKDTVNATTQLPPNGTAQIEREKPASRKVYQVTPAIAVGFFLLELGTAIGHGLFLESINNKTVSNQVWMNRYSLAMAFIVKSSLAAAIPLVYVQRLWFPLQQTRHGVTARAIDALFTVLESLPKFFTLDMWRRSFLAAMIATFVWLMSLAALISPTSLSVGSMTQSSRILDCIVPTLNMTSKNWQSSGTSLSLSTVSYTGISYNPSMTARRMVGATCQSGQQLGWSVRLKLHVQCQLYSTINHMYPYIGH